MSGQPTRAGLSPDATNRSLTARLPEEWRGFARFLRRPELPDRAEVSLRGSLRALPSLFALDMALMALVLGAIGLAAALGVKLPDHLLNEMQVTPALVALIVIGAPIAEEALFRGWLSGRAGHIVSVAAVLAGGAALVFVDNVIAKLAGIAGGIVIALAALYLLRGRPALPWFQRHFRWLYYASALLFASVHLTNFGSGGMSLAMLPLVLPQFTLALVLGYLRVHRGLPTGAALHMLHNAAFAGVMVAGAS
jgi:membrane protease YdiL (CAAX protease family)